MTRVSFMQPNYDSSEKKKKFCMKFVNQLMNFLFSWIGFYFDFPQFIFNIVDKPKYLKLVLSKQNI